MADTTENTKQEKLEEFQKLVDDFDLAMLVTEAEDGRHCFAHDGHAKTSARRGYVVCHDAR